MPNTTAFITRCCKNTSLAALLALWLALAHAGSIEPRQASVQAGDEGYTLSADFGIDLGNRLEDALTHGVTLYFTLEFILERPRKYWVAEHLTTRNVGYRLSYSSLTRQYRLSNGSLHRNYARLDEALRVLGHVAALPVADKGLLKPGEAYAAAVRLSLDRNQLPKPFQLDAITDRDWQVDAKVLRWQFSLPAP